MTITYPKRKLTDTVELGIKINCDHCHANISQVIRIQCAECSEIDLCVECFSEGIAVKPNHEPTHAYKVIEPFSFPIFEPDWRADEELLLLEAAISVGLGNWVDISEFIGTKSIAECEAHYHRLFIESDAYPLPNPALDIRKKKNLPLPQGIKKMKEAPGEIPVSQPAIHEIAGYMPLRVEFETEIENEAENLVKDLQFLDEDTEQERELKLAALHHYDNVLDKRAERKKFVAAHGLLEFKRHSGLDKSRTKDERDIYHRLCPFERFMSLSDFEAFYQGFVDEARLLKRIAALQEYRRQGIRDFETAVIYDKELAAHSMGASMSTLVGGSGGGVLTPSKTIGLSGSMVSSASTHISHLYPPPPPPPLGPTLGSEPQQTAASTGSAVKPPLVRRSLGSPLDISDAEGVELLSSSERNLCSILRLLPKLYLSIKETLIAAYHKHGHLKRAQARALIKIDVNKTSKIYDFFISSGWIKSSLSASSSSDGPPLAGTQPSPSPIMIKLSLGKKEESE